MEGNQQKIREALEEILLICYKAGARRYGYDVACGLIKAKAKKALSVPPCNCDVGTAEEQDERFKKFCLSYYEPCNVDGECWKCPLFKTKTRCPIAWAQMPYEAQEGDGK